MSIKYYSADKEDIKTYQNTCSEFLKDLSVDYLSWVDRYQLTNEETKKRKDNINEIVRKSNHIIYKFGDTIKKIDIIMNDGISKMAEQTAGYPFQLMIIVNNLERYTYSVIGEIKLNIKGIPRYGKSIRIGRFDNENMILLNSSSPVEYHINKSSLEPVDVLDDFIIIDAKNCKHNDIISTTVIVEEVNEEIVFEKRGLSTLILIVQR